MFASLPGLKIKYTFVRVSSVSLGTLKKISNSDAADMQAYILQGDKKYHLVKKTNANAYIPAYRHFFQLSDNTQNISEFGLDMVDDEDGIQYIEMLEEDGTANYYDLSGRKLPGKPERGVYIKNNRKFSTK